ncbi:MAG: hypothetical protein COV74_07575 [Candidatus Omnitrophica bacterium CG11_big_fil_rev_8_21_14_0_20_45_26]|uniref:Lipid A biosynthesis acyltransferase n=1 Tax=Candidatus Abzuiibacterium crystallinum TaxID=1974748 RepID=A0A2H0LN03_9BACT|nr:MAG: hypothetical protein COV74_07575 [Candidatus Omnitrophica bacterium CG11_big_fil_rev_8_21_14_0_20_45_26]PIW64143.1 MAG: hypothetical protein COW12_07455 [Candidatus Omnitrophica bacterium CG12_big_fil_rev_8_21_14_0_65_45_16]
MKRSKRAQTKDGYMAKAIYPLRKSIYLAEFLFFRFVAAMANLIPYSFTIFLSRQVGILLFHALPKRQKIAIQNLQAAFPEKNSQEIKSIARDAFINMARVAVEFVCIPTLAKKGYIQNVHAERVHEALKQKKGLILIVSHLTNWEVMAAATAMAGLPMHAIARPIKNPYVYQYITHMRGYAGLQLVDKLGAIRKTVTLLKANQVVSFLIDQHERQGAVSVQFFGRQCWASGLAARVAAKMNVPVIFAYCKRDEHAKIITFYEPEFSLVKTKNLDRDTQANTQLFTTAIEKRIREMPGNWLWMHRRWREMPDKN